MHKHASSLHNVLCANWCRMGRRIRPARYRGRNAVVDISILKRRTPQGTPLRYASVAATRQSNERIQLAAADYGAKSDSRPRNGLTALRERSLFPPPQIKNPGTAWVCDGGRTRART